MTAVHSLLITIAVGVLGWPRFLNRLVARLDACRLHRRRHIALSRFYAAARAHCEGQGRPHVAADAKIR